MPHMIKLITLFILILASNFALAKHQDLSLIAPKANLDLPDPEIKKEEKTITKSKPLGSLEMSDNFTLQPRLEYENYLDIKPTKPQTFGFNLNWDI